MKTLKILAIAALVVLAGLFGLGLLIQANQTPQEKAAQEARTAERKKAEANKELEAPHAPNELQVNASQEKGDHPDERDKRSTDQTDSGKEQKDQNNDHLVDKIRRIATNVEWNYSKQESPFDGAIYSVSKSFKSDEYEADISVLIKCVQQSKDFSITFVSHVYDADGNTSEYLSSFTNTTDMEGDPVAVNGRVKWAGRQPEKLSSLLFQRNDAFALGTSDIMDAAGVKDLSLSEAFTKLLPAYIELSNNAGTFTLSIPANNAAINRVVSACD